MLKKRERSASVGENVNRKKCRRSDDDDDDDSAASNNTATESAILKSPRFTVSQMTAYTQREAGIIEEIHTVNFMSHSKLSFQYVSFVVCCYL